MQGKFKLNKVLIQIGLQVQTEQILVLGQRQTTRKYTQYFPINK